MLNYDVSFVSSLKPNRPFELAQHFIQQNPKRLYVVDGLLYRSDGCDWFDTPESDLADWLVWLAAQCGLFWVRPQYVADTISVLMSLVRLNGSLVDDHALPDGHYPVLKDAAGRLLISRRVPNGVGFSVIDSDPRIFCSKRVGYEFDLKATCSVFKGFLTSVLDQEQVELVLAYFAACLTDRRVFNPQTSLVLLGNGGNGKSTLMDIMSQVFGLENVATKPLESLLAPKERVNIAHKTLIIVDDAPSYIKETAQLKSLISGEPVEFRPLYRPPFSSNRYGRIVINTNQLPKFTDTSNGMYRRLQIVQFERTIPPEQQDTTLAWRIGQFELPGILNLVLSHNTLIHTVLKPSTKANDLLAALHAENDSVYSYYIDEIAESGLCVYDERAIVMYDEYRSYAVQAGVTPVGRNTFISRMVRLGFTKVRRSDATYLVKKL
jgi:putative DNA primase/helicase